MWRRYALAQFSKVTVMATLAWIRCRRRCLQLRADWVSVFAYLKDKGYKVIQAHAAILREHIERTLLANLIHSTKA